MKILVVGKGGREHALALACSQSPLCTELYAAPGNPGMAQFAHCVEISDSDIDGLVAFAKEKAIDLTVVGPEATLALGIVDAFHDAGLKIFGPTKAATQVEASKDFAKKIMAKYDIPTAAYQTFDNEEDAWAYVQAQGAPIVVKEDGLKAGKGVTVCQTIDQAKEALDVAFAIEGNRVVIEECLVGFEFSLISLVHNDKVYPLEVAQDHKPVGDGDVGANTGGMGSYSPVKKITPALKEEALEKIIYPMAKAMVKEGVPFTGFLYGGLMETKDGVKTIEFNARFGDPEAEVILPRLESDFVQAMLDVMDDKPVDLKWTKQVSHGVVMASTNYPQSSTKGAVIEIPDDLNGYVYHMGTKMQDGHLVTDGGRVLMVTNMADTLEEAFKKTYEDVKRIQCSDLFYRHDIGKKDMD